MGMGATLTEQLRATLQRGTVIPAHPLALTAACKLDERRQRALSRYYIAAGAGGLAVGVHTTQFAIREPRHGLYKPVLTLAAEEMDRADQARAESLLRVAGICGDAAQATAEAETAADLGYHTGLLSLAAMRGAAMETLLEHVRRVAAVIPVFGFYLQPAVGGIPLSYEFWRRFADIERVAAIKVACFNRYQTLDVVRALADSGRSDIALYTGNDDNIVADLVTPYRFERADGPVTLHFVGGLLGHWAAWTHGATGVLQRCHEVVAAGNVPRELLQTGIEVTDMNAALFDVANAFHGCIAGIHEILRRQGLLEGIWCLDPKEGLSPGQAEALDRVCRAYPHLVDDDFVQEHRDTWLSG